MTWLYNRNRRSSLAAILLLHFMINFRGEFMSLSDRRELMYTVSRILAAVVLASTGMGVAAVRKADRSSRHRPLSAGLSDPFDAPYPACAGRVTLQISVASSAATDQRLLLCARWRQPLQLRPWAPDNSAAAHGRTRSLRIGPCSCSSTPKEETDHDGCLSSPLIRQAGRRRARPVRTPPRLRPITPAPYPPRGPA